MKGCLSTLVKVNEEAKFTRKQIIQYALMFLGGLLICYQLYFFILVCWFSVYNPTDTSMMAYQRARITSTQADAALKHEWVPLDKISRHLQRAVITAEDSKFMQHHGFDWEGIKTAYEKNRKHGKIVAGGSTISQQLAKNLFLSTDKTPWRKAQEAIITTMIESVMSKQRILTLYLNVVEWGNGVFGIQAAAQHYYQHSARSLSRYESATLAAMLPNPRYYDKHRYTYFLQKRTNRILKYMHTIALPKQ